MPRTRLSNILGGRPVLWVKEGGRLADLQWEFDWGGEERRRDLVEEKTMTFSVFFFNFNF
jgi:hypothetical protein